MWGRWCTIIQTFHLNIDAKNKWLWYRWTDPLITSLISAFCSLCHSVMYLFFQFGVMFTFSRGKESHSPAGNTSNYLIFHRSTTIICSTSKTIHTAVPNQWSILYSSYFCLFLLYKYVKCVSAWRLQWLLIPVTQNYLFLIILEGISPF